MYSVVALIASSIQLKEKPEMKNATKRANTQTARIALEAAAPPSKPTPAPFPVNDFSAEEREAERLQHVVRMNLIESVDSHLSRCCVAELFMLDEILNIRESVDDQNGTIVPLLRGMLSVIPD